MKYLLPSLAILGLIGLAPVASAETVYSHVGVTSGVDVAGNITGAPDGAASTFISTAGFIETGFPIDSNGDATIQYTVDTTRVPSITVWFMDGASIEHTALVSFVAEAPTGELTIVNPDNVTFDRIRIMPEDELFGIDAAWITTSDTETVAETTETTTIETETTNSSSEATTTEETTTQRDEEATAAELIARIEAGDTSISAITLIEKNPNFPRLIKLPDDGDASTQYDSAVYAIDKTGKRRPFTSETIYRSWFLSFDHVEVIGAEEMASYQLGRPMPMHHGSYLVKIQSDNNVYAIERGSVLRRIPTEGIAASFYGANWADRVRDLAPTDWPHYTIGSDLSSVLPDDTIIMDRELRFWHIRNGVRREIKNSELIYHGVQLDHPLPYGLLFGEAKTAALLALYTAGAPYNLTDDFGWYDF